MHVKEISPSDPMLWLLLSCQIQSVANIPGNKWQRGGNKGGDTS